MQEQLLARHRNKNRIANLGKKPSKQVQTLEKRLHEAMEKHYDLDTWGFNSYFVSHILKVRALENLIDCAQRIKYRGPDENLQNELVLLK